VTISSNNSPVLKASSYIDTNQELVASASLLAEAVIAAFRDTPTVTVDLAGLRSVSSSYFNTLLLDVADRYGIDAIRTRLLFRFSSAAQHEIFQRSYIAALKDVDGENDSRTLDGGVVVGLVRYPKESRWAIQSVFWPHFAAKYASQMTTAQVDIVKSGWDKLRFDSKAEAHAFVVEKILRGKPKR
jgi:hypothetical protein